MLGLPIDAFDCHAWTLVKYGLISTGGSYLFGEPYWLGGLPMIVLFHLLFGLIFSLGDLYFYRRRSKGKFIGHYVGAALLMLIGFGYGFSGWMRAFYMLLFSELALRLYEKRKAFVGKEYTNKVIIEQN
jgi:hypothetical protein